MEKQLTLKEKLEGPAMIIGIVSSVLTSAVALFIVLHHINKSK